jgi:AcrR family transcriptional regulator
MIKCKIKEKIDSRVKKGMETRDRILQAAIDLITEKGPKFLSAGNIAKKVEISKSSIFHHFKSVEEIPFAIFELFVTTMLESVGEKSSKSVTEYINNLGVEVIEKTGKEKQFAKSFTYFMQKAIVNDKYKASMMRMADVWRDTIRMKLEEVSKEKISDEKMTSIILIFSMCHRGLAQFNLLRELEDRDEYLRAWKLFSEAIGAQFGETPEGIGA